MKVIKNAEELAKLVDENNPIQKAIEEQNKFQNEINNRKFKT